MLRLLSLKKIWIPPLLILLAFTGNFLINSKADEEFLVETEIVEVRDIVQKINASGKIQPEEAVQITSTITGWITEITVVEGDTVDPGQHLISIDEKQIRPRYDNALSQVKSSEANLRKVQSQLSRIKSLFSQKLISSQELEQVDASFQIAQSQFEQANANLLSAKDELSKTKLTAPKYGIVTSITKETGEMAVGGMFNPGVLMTIADLNKMEVEVDVNENDVVNIDIGDTSEIEIDAYPDTIFFGTVSEIAHTAQTNNLGVQQQVTNFKVKVRMLSVPEKIRPGMSSTVNIITDITENSVSIPIQSLTSRPENFDQGSNVDKTNNYNIKPIDVVFIIKNTFGKEKAIEGKGYAIVSPIDVGISSENYYQVLSGVSKGDKIVTGGYRVLSKDLYHGSIVYFDNE